MNAQKKIPQEADIAKELTQIGLSYYEAQIYIGLLRRGLTVAGALAKYLALKRSTVYATLETLIEKGLVSTTSHAGVRQFQAESSNRLFDLLEQQKRQIRDQEETLKCIKPLLEDLRTERDAPPQVSIYEGQQGILNLLFKTLENAPEEILVIGQKNVKEDHIPSFTKKRIELKIPTRVIAPDSKWLKGEIKKDKISHRKTHAIKGYPLPASIHISNQSVILFTSSGKEPVGVHIENKDIAESFKMIFEMLEKNLK